jgi:hypothetical protein
VDLVVAVEKCDVLTSFWQADRYTELICPVKKRKKEEEEKNS